MSGCAIGGPASKLARSGESCAVLIDKLLQRHRRAAADFFDEIIRASEDAVLVINGNFTQMLDGEGISLTFGF